MTPENRLFEAKLKVLGDYVRHRLKEDEGAFFDHESESMGQNPNTGPTKSPRGKIGGRPLGRLDPQWK